MSRRVLAGASALVVATMVVVALGVGSVIPAEAMLPTHWNIAGEADGFAGKWTALLLPPLLVSVISALFFALPALEPRREGLARSQGLYQVSWAALLLVLAAADLAIVSMALGWALPVDRLILAAGGAMLTLIGNQLGKSRSMYLIGVRTPWTLASEEVWIRTHRLAGKLMVGSGLLVVAITLIDLPSAFRGTVAGAAIAASALVPTVYSYWLWRRERDQPRG
jgi:uncharacterized membrane protein